MYLDLFLWLITTLGPKVSTYYFREVEYTIKVREIFSGFWSLWGFFFCLYKNGVRFKKITNLGKSYQFGTTSYAQIVSIRHDFCHVILKSCQLGTTSALSY